MGATNNLFFDHALALLEERRYLEAVEAFSELASISPDFPGVYGNRGLAYLNLGYRDEAKKDFEMVLELDPEDAMGHAMLAELARYHGGLEESLGHAIEAMELDENEPQSHFVRGWLFAKAGQYYEATEDLARFMDLTDESSDVLDLYEACLILAEENPTDDYGDSIADREAEDAYLGKRGWSFDMRANPDYEAQGHSCAYAHCIRNSAPMSAETPDGCPVYGYACPGQREQVAWCRENPQNND